MSVAKNTSYMTAASIIQKVISFVYFAILARVIGPEDLGKYSTALAFTAIFIIFVDVGLTNIMVRESARAFEKAQTYLSAVLGVKLITGILSYGVLVGVVVGFGYETSFRPLLYWAGITMLFDALHQSFYGVLRAVGRLRYEAVGIVGSQFLTLILGFLCLWLNLPLVSLIIAFAVSSILNAIYAGLVVHRVYHLSLVPTFRGEFARSLIRMAVPFMLAGMFMKVYSYVDQILLQRLAGNDAAGVYSVPSKLAYAFQFIPIALMAGLYPRLSEWYVKDKERLVFVFHQAFKYLLIVSFPVAVGIAVLAKQIVLFVFSDQYLASVLPMQIFVSGVVFSFLSFLMGAVLNACNKQTTQTTIVGLVMLVTVTLNIVLIPRFGPVGAAIAAVIGSVLMTVSGFVFVQPLVKCSYSFIAVTLLQVGVSSMVMGICVWLVSLHFPVFVAAGVGGVVYVGLLFTTKAVRKQQLQEVWRLVKQ